MASFLHQQRTLVHRRVVTSITEMISLFTAFVLIFTGLLIMSNWPAYSLVFQDWIDPGAMAKRQVADNPEDSGFRFQSPSLLATSPKDQGQENLFSLADLGELYPGDMRLEVPKVFSGTIPVKKVEVKDFDFKELYASENKIQESLREGVVHYPYTANPDQYGNVFITGHSSYYPWDKGRYKEIFALLHKLEKGDQYLIYYKGGKYTYQVTDIFEVGPDDVSVLEQPVDQKISSLMTCTPIGTVLRRLIVRGELVQ